MRTLTFELIADDRFQYYIRRNLQTKIEYLERKFSDLDGVYLKIEKPYLITFDGETNKQYRAFCSVVKESKTKYTWNDIMGIINKVYAPVYKYCEQLYPFEEYKEIKEKRNSVQVISAHLENSSNDETRYYSTGIMINGEKSAVDVIRKINNENKEEWVVESYDEERILSDMQKESIIKVIKDNPPINIKTKLYIDEEIESIEDLSYIKFDEEIEVDDNNKVNLYFANAYELFLTPAEDIDFNYYDGYLTIDIQNNKAEIEIVVISENDDRIYYTYEPTEEETKKLIKAANEYCQECYDQNLEEFYNEIIDEEEENEQ